MGSQGFRNIAGNPFVYQEDVRSAAIGLDYTAAKWKIAVSASAGVLPTSTAQVVIDPATDGNITITPNGAGLFIIGSASYPKTVAVGDVLVASALNTVGVVAGATTAGYVLTANGAGNAPTFQAAASGGVTTIQGDTGSVTGATVKIAGGSNISTSCASTTLTVALANSPSVSGSLTAGTYVSAGTYVGAGTYVSAGSYSAATTYLQAGTDLKLPSTTSSAGRIMWNSVTMIHTGETDGYFFGNGAGRYDTNTRRNIGIGTSACAYPSNNGSDNGADNICIGIQTLYDGGVTHYNGNVYQNVAIGNYALSHLNANCGGNTCVGYNAGHKIDASGAGNTLIGCNAGYQLYMNPGVHGVENDVAIGNGAGGAWVADESSNIAINSPGVAGDNHVLRIGAASGTGQQQLNKAYIHGIYGVTPGGTQNVALIDSNGQLGSTATLSPSLGGAMTWTEVTSASQAAAVGNGYITNYATLLTVTLPATAAVGQRVALVGKGAGLWKLAQNASQVIHFGGINSTTGTGGYLAATGQYDCVEVICITANTDWVVRDSVGVITIV